MPISIRQLAYGTVGLHWTVCLCVCLPSSTLCGSVCQQVSLFLKGIAQSKLNFHFLLTPVSLESLLTSTNLPNNSVFRVSTHWMCVVVRDV